MSFFKIKYVGIFLMAETVFSFAGENVSTEEDFFEKWTKELPNSFVESVRSILYSGTNIITPISIYGSHTLKSSISGDKGDVSSSVWGISSNYMYLSNNNKIFSLNSLDYHITSYNFSDNFVPFNDVRSLSFFTYNEYIYDLEKGRGIGGFFRLGTFEDTDLSFNDGVSYAGGVFGKMYFSRQTSLALGVVGAYRITREDYMILPFVMYNWEIMSAKEKGDPTMNLRIADTTSLSYDFNGDKKYVLSGLIAYKTDSFKTLNVGSKDAAYEAKRFTIGTSFEWTIRKDFFVNFAAEYDLYSKNTQYIDGNRAGNFKIHPTMRFFIQTGVKF